MTVAPAVTEVRCPHCGRKQFAVDGGASGRIERVCDRCGRLLVIDLGRIPGPYPCQVGDTCGTFRTTEPETH